MILRFPQTWKQREEMNIVSKRIKLIREMVHCEDYMAKLYAIAIPSALYMMMNMFVNLVDTVMIGRLGEVAIASVGLANKLFFVFILINFGVCSGSGILASQFYGHGDIKNLRKVMGLALNIALLNGLAFSAIGILYPKFVMGIFSTSPDTIELGARYIRIVCLSYPLVALNGVYVSTLRSTGEVKIPIIVTATAIVVNIVFNYFLIFGAFGFPRMGAEGAALATLLARIVEAILIVTMIYRKKNVLACKISEMYGYSRELIHQFLLRALPVIGNEFMWGLGTTLYSVAYGRMGNEAVSAITIAATLQDMTTVLLSGIASSTVVILGNELGANKLENAKKYARYSLHIAVLASLIIMVILTALKHPFLHLYEVSPDVRAATIACITVFSFMVPFKSIAWVNIVGILRSGGDTLACLFLDTSGVWFIGVPLAFIAGLVWKLPIYWVFACVSLEEIYKVVLGLIRYKQGKWIRNLAAEVE